MGSFVQELTRLTVVQVFAANATVWSPFLVAYIPSQVLSKVQSVPVTIPFVLVIATLLVLFVFLLVVGGSIRLLFVVQFAGFFWLEKK